MPADRKRVAELARRILNTGKEDVVRKYVTGGPRKNNQNNKQEIPFWQKIEGQIRPVIVTPDRDYTVFLNSLPDNQRFTPESEYSTRRYWELNGKPKDFEAAKKLGMYTFDSSDGMWHANSVAWGDDGVGYFMKPKHHDTLKYELDWYNNGLVTEEGGKQRKVTGKEEKEWKDFVSMYDLDTSGDFYKYIPRKKRSMLEESRIDIKPLSVDTGFVKRYAGGCDMAQMMGAVGPEYMSSLANSVPAYPTVETVNVNPSQEDETQVWQIPQYGHVPEYSQPAVVPPAVKPAPAEEPVFDPAAVQAEYDSMLDNILLRQRYAESGFNDRAVNNSSGAAGAYQIMPIAYKDYLQRGRGKEGDLMNAAYNRLVRDHVIKMAPKDLGEEFYTDHDTALERHAKEMAVFNAGGGTVRKALRKAVNAGMDITSSFDWLQFLPKETRDYVNFIVLGQEIENSGKNEEAYQAALTKFNNRHDLGGLVSRINKAYGGDRKKMSDAIGRIKAANKFDGGGDKDGDKYVEETDPNFIGPVLPTYSGGNMDAAVTSASLPSIKTANGKRIAHNMAKRVVAGQMQMGQVPRSYRSYVEGEAKGAIPTSEAMDAAGREVLPLVMGAAAGPGGIITAMAGRAVDMMVNAATKGEKNSWGDLFFDAEKHPRWHFAAEMTNPGYLVSLGNASTAAAERAVYSPTKLGRKLRKIQKLYSQGKESNSTQFARWQAEAEQYRKAGEKSATVRKSFTEAEKDKIYDNILQMQAQRSRDLFRRVGKDYDSVLDYYSTTDELKKIFTENPEYLLFISENHLDPLAEETVNAFAKRQFTSVRGVHIPSDSQKDIEKDIEKVMTEFGRNSGGDRLQTKGGVYSSNSTGLADRFSRPIDGTSEYNVISTLSYPIPETSGDVAHRLRQIRRPILNRHEWYQDTGASLGMKPNLKNYRFIEEQYATRDGLHLPVHERATTGPADVVSIHSNVRSGLANMKGRWGQDAVPHYPTDDALFIPKVTTIADFPGIVTGGKVYFNQQRFNDFMANIYLQHQRQTALTRGSLPYKFGRHIANNTVSLFGKNIYQPVIPATVVGGVGAGVIALTDAEIKGSKMAAWDENGAKTKIIAKSIYGDKYPPRLEDGSIDIKKLFEMQNTPEFRKRYKELYEKETKEKKVK